jgi:hypothetical protein
MVREQGVGSSNLPTPTIIGLCAHLGSMFPPASDLFQLYEMHGAYTRLEAGAAANEQLHQLGVLNSDF